MRILFRTALALFFGVLLDWLQCPRTILALTGGMEPWRLLFLSAGIPGRVTYPVFLSCASRRDQVSSIAEETDRDIFVTSSREKSVPGLLSVATMCSSGFFFAQVDWAPQSSSPSRNKRRMEGATLGPAFLASGYWIRGVLLPSEGLRGPNMTRIMSVVFMIGIGF